MDFGVNHLSDHALEKFANCWQNSHTTVVFDVVSEPRFKNWENILDFPFIWKSAVLK